MNEKWTLNEHNKTFLSWFNPNVYSQIGISKTQLRLAHGPTSDVISYGGYYINIIFLFLFKNRR